MPRLSTAFLLLARRRARARRVRGLSVRARRARSTRCRASSRSTSAAGRRGRLRRRSSTTRPQRSATSSSCTFNGPLRNNGADKLPSLDWKIAFSGLTTQFTSRVVSTGDNFFINLGGQDFEVGQEARAAARRPGARVAAEGARDRRASTRSPPCATSRRAAPAPSAAPRQTVYTRRDRHRRGDGPVSSGSSQSLPTAGATAAVPTGHLTAAQRAQVKRTFSQPALRGRRGRRRHHPPAQLLHLEVHDPGGQPRGGRRHHRRAHRVPRSQYTDVGEPTTITAPIDTQPIGDFRSLQRQQIPRNKATSQLQSG